MNQPKALAKNTMISVEKLTKKHPGASAATLRELSFAVEEGRIVALLGKSGAGKSTLLRCLSGLDGFDSGAIVVDGVTVTGGGAPDALRGRVGFVFQSLELFPHLSVLENCVLAPMVVKRADRATSVRKAKELLKDLQVDVDDGAHPGALSGGQRQRVAIVRALMMEPRVLLYDEPTSALDPSLKAEVGKTLKEVAERTGMTQLVVTHDPTWAQAVCEHVLELKDGLNHATAVDDPRVDGGPAPDGLEEPVSGGSADRELEQKSSFSGGAARPSLEKAPCSSYPRGSAQPRRGLSHRLRGRPDPGPHRPRRPLGPHRERAPHQRHQARRRRWHRGGTASGSRPDDARGH